MPKWLHDKLARAARKKGFTGKRFKRYVFGGLHRYEESIRSHLKKKKKKKGKRKVARP